MATALQLAEAHQRRVDSATQLIAREVLTTARRVAVGDVDSWWRSAGSTIQRLITGGFTQTARLAVQFLGDGAALEGLELEPVAAVLDTEALLASLQVVGPISFKRQMARSGNTDAALRSMSSQLAGAAVRWTRAGDRGTIFATADTYPQTVVGYKRQAEAGACKFCEMLAGRGAVYLSQESGGQVVGRGGRARGTQKIGRAFHDHCHCRVVPVYGTGPARPRVRQPSSIGEPGGLVARLVGHQAPVQQLAHLLDL